MNNQNFVESVSYLFERGGKREKRTEVARDTTSVAAADGGRRRAAARASRREQAFINVLLAKSTLDLARENLKNFSNVVDVNRERMRAGDLAESEFYKISLQKLQFEQDLSAAEVGAGPGARPRCARTSATRAVDRRLRRRRRSGLPESQPSRSTI